MWTWTGQTQKLAEITTAQALVAALNDLAQEHRINLRELRTEPRADDFTRFGGVSHRDGEGAWEVLTGRRAPSLSAVRRIVVDICGCPEGAFYAWEAAWQRVRDGDPASVAVPAIPIAATPAPDTVPAAAGPGIVDDASATAAPAAPVAVQNPPPRPPWWRRALRLR